MNDMINKHLNETMNDLMAIMNKVQNTFLKEQHITPPLGLYLDLALNFSRNVFKQVYICYLDKHKQIETIETIDEFINKLRECLTKDMKDN